ncbi:MAG: hypothetical protein AABX50_02470 [Nanoarchaeota archaeon]
MEKRSQFFQKKNRRGQFYLISAIILAAIIISLITISNYSKKDESADLENLKDEIQIESAKVIDYGINNSLTQPAMNQLIQNFTQQYIDSQSRDKNLYFIFGKEDNVTLKGYQNEAHDVILEGTTIPASLGAFLWTLDPATSSVNLTIDKNSYIFTLKNGENFYFLVSRESRGGSYVVTG